MDLSPSPRARSFLHRLHAFLDECVYSSEERYRDELRRSGNPHLHAPVLEELKSEARARELWNLFMPDERFGPGLSNLDYAPIAELSGRSPLAPEAMNCSAPDTGNMEILSKFGTKEQQDRWLSPLLSGEIRSCFCMTEPEVASSDPTNLQATIVREGADLVVNGHKWWTTGAAHENCSVALFMGVSRANADRHHRHSLVLVPLDHPGVSIARTLPVFGYDDGGGHCEITFEDVRVSDDSFLGEEGQGFAIAQSRLGAGRIHHCMRALGLAERALELMCRRALQRVAFGKPLADQGRVEEAIARSRIEIEQARLLVLKTAWLIDNEGQKSARTEISAIKAAVPRVATGVVDRAIQIHGGAGLSDDFPLSAMYAHTRSLRILDGPDEVHEMAVARRELDKHR
jgi:acyl-CoA dehydrogenase